VHTRAHTSISLQLGVRPRGCADQG
jgi:hypothetical protein